MPQLPIHDGGASCTLDEQGAAQRDAQFANVVERGLRHRERSADGAVRLTFDKSERLEEDVRELVRQESQCCAFFSFDVLTEEDKLIIHVDAPDSKTAYLDELYRATRPG
ncbi:MAG: hypothetical protein M3O70_19690 [Actinomycetota bacterium]|nr:hypothetical protein [Actinomycetota bacterium]